MCPHRGSRVYAEESLREACELQETMEADMGGTEILRPLTEIYERPPIPEYSRQVRTAMRKAQGIISRAPKPAAKCCVKAS